MTKSRQQRYNERNPEVITKAQAKWASNHKQIKVNFDRTTDADLIAWLEAQPSAQAAIKAALRAVAGL